jgi:amino acid adenylation domain-containing protein
MREATELLDELASQGILLWTEADQLRFRAPDGRLTDDLKAEIRALRPQIIAALRLNKGLRDEPGHIPTVPGPQDSFTASFAQQRLWFVHQLEPDNPSYNMLTAFELEGDVQAGPIGRALTRLVDRHEPLRTTFISVDGMPRQVVHRQLDHVFHVHDVSHLAADAAETAFKSIVASEARHRFDLTNGPVLLAHLWRLSNRRARLLFNVHHITADGWSIAVIARELSQLYAAETHGVPPDLPPLRVQYKDFAHWQQQRLSGETLNHLLDYWRAQLADAPPSLRLPLDRPRPAKQSFRGAVELFSIDSSLAGELQQVSRQQGATLFMTLFAAFSALLARYGGTDDVVVASPIANRNHVEIEPLVGFFVNTLVLRMKLSGAPSFAELIQTAKATALAAYERQDLPFERLVQELQPQRGLNYPPLFQVAFVLHNVPDHAPQSDSIRLKPFFVETETSRQDIWFSLNQDGSRLEGIVEYNSDIFDGETIRRMVGHYKLLLRALVDDVQQCIHEMPLVSEAEAALLLQWSTGPRLPNDYEVVHRMIEAAVERSPDAPAIDAPDGSLSYAELNCRANVLARRLRASGLEAESIVGICLDPSADLVVAILAVLKAGGAYLPLDPAYPDDRLAFMAEQSHARVLITHSSIYISGKLNAVAGRLETICLDFEEAPETQTADGNPIYGVSGRQLAYVIFTSGSTGRPKAVAVEHRSLCNLMIEYISALQLGLGKRVLQYSAFSFDASVVELFSALGSGACLVLQPRSALMPDSGLVDVLRRKRVSAVILPPSSLAVMPYGELPDLETLMVAGETCPPALAVKWGRGRRFFNAYGPTEATVGVTEMVVEHTDGELIPIGRPHRNTVIRVLDDHLLLVPPGVAGQLYIGGLQLARGYLGAPDLTADRFLPDLFMPGNRLYRTGDLARYRPDGVLEFLGRIDDQVKLRGFRIELGEIEAVLRAHHQVRDAAVTLQTLADGDRTIAAFVVPEYPNCNGEASGGQAWTSREQINQWQQLFDESYRNSEDVEDATFNIAGWNSSLTGSPLLPEEMADWVHATVGRILALHPERILELGCGTGLLLYRIAPGCTSYVATDISRRALESVAEQLAPRNLEHVVLKLQSADDFTGIEPESFDTIVMNSIVQYFPSVEYLLQVLRGAVGATRRGGRIFLGDVRCVDWLPALYQAKAWAKDNGATTVGEMESRIAREMAAEEELALDPAFFLALRACSERVTSLKILLKRSVHNNELVRFRLDIVIGVEEEPSGVACETLPWSTFAARGWTFADALRDPRHESIHLTDVPNARLMREAFIDEWMRTAPRDRTLNDASPLFQQRGRSGEDPERFWQIGDETGLHVEVRYPVSGRPEHYDVLVGRSPLPGQPPAAMDGNRPPCWERWANNPLHAKLAGPLKAVLTDYLRATLPDYMIPPRLEVLTALPTSPSGKIDRRRLPIIDAHRVRIGSTDPPLTATGHTVAEIWCQLLGITEVGADDNFFDLGGHSLMAVKLVTRLSERFGVPFSVNEVFEHQVLGALASHADNVLASAHETRTNRESPADSRQQFVLTPMQTIADHRPVPLSFAQERLWFLQQLEGPDALYNMPLALRFKGPLDVAALERSLALLVHRHGILRTTFQQDAQDMPVQVLSAESQVALEQVSPADWDHSHAALGSEAARPFPLQDAPPWRVKLFHVADGEAILLLTLHHILADGWSISRLVQELKEIYHADISGISLALAEPMIQYRDYALWQRQQFETDNTQELIQHWQAQLRGIPGRLALPTDRPCPAVETHPGSLARFRIEPALAAELRELSRNQHTTLFMTLLAGFCVLLARYSGQRDLVIGTPIANRNRKDVEELIGLFLNTVPIRIKLDGDPTVAALLERVRTASIDAFAHSEMPFEKLIQCLDVARDPAFPPVVQVLFVVQDQPVGASKIGDLQIAPLELPSQTSKFPLSLYIFTTEPHLEGAFEYNTDLFDRSTVERLRRHLEQLYREMVASPERPVASLQLMSQSERAEISGHLEGPAPSALLQPSPLELFALQARRSPERIALELDGRTLTYGELDRRSSQLAQVLRTQFAIRGSVVGLGCRPSFELIVGLLAIQRAGAAWLPLDPGLPLERLAGMVEDADVHLILTDRQSSAALPAASAEHVILEDLLPTLDGLPETVIDTPDERDLAYIIYTSGSTGTPKGVMITHGSLATFLHAMHGRPGMSQDDVSLLLTTISFDISILEMMLPLIAGARLVIADSEARTDAFRLARLLEETHVSYMQATPGTWRMLIDAGWRPVRPMTILCGGDALPLELSQALLDRVPHFWHMYGPTETTIWSAARLVDRPPDVNLPAPAYELLGGPIAQTQFYILDSEGQQVPPGASGELFIGGVGLAAGYHRFPGLTAGKFLPDPFGTKSGARMYQTGDMVRLRPDGAIEYLERRDFQVKIRGFRVELGEIEATLHQCEGVIRAVVLAIGATGLDRCLWAFVAARAPLDTSRLKNDLSRQLPAYMVPSQIVSMNQIPLLHNGKIDRKSLAAMAATCESARPPAASDAFRNQREIELADVWHEVLGVRPAHHDDQFFDLGGHSLLIVKLIARIQKRFGVRLLVREVFHHPVLCEMALLLGEELCVEEVHLPVSAHEMRDVFPATHAQKSMWVLSRATDAPAFNMSVGYLVTGEIEPGLWQQAFSTLIDRHESLRTSFIEDGRGLHQRVHEPCGARLTLDYRDLRDEDHPRQSAEVIAATLAATPFDLSQPFLLRASLLRLSAWQYYFLLSVHHIVFDEGSLKVFMEQFLPLATGSGDPHAGRYAATAHQYREFARTEDEMLHGPRRDAMEEYWRTQLDRSRALNLPCDFDRPAASSFHGSSITHDFSPELTARLETLQGQTESSLYIVLLTALNILLFRYSGQDDIVIGCPVANRTATEDESMIGLLMNVLPIRSRVDPRMSFAELAVHIRETLLGGLDHQQYPLSLIVQQAARSRNPGRAGLFDIGFTWHDGASFGQHAGEVRLDAVPVPYSFVKADLWFHGWRLEHSLRMVVEFGAGRFKEATVRIMVQRLEALLVEIAGHPDRPLDRFSFGAPVKPGVRRLAIDLSLERGN